MHGTDGGTDQMLDDRPEEAVSPRHATGVRPQTEEAVAPRHERAPVPATTWGNSLTKRCCDLLGSALLLLASAPLWPIVSLLIRLESPGPILVRQSRAGRSEAPFRIAKFRSMREAPTSEDDAQLTRKERNARRTTRLGQLLRRTSLDELPQLLNVLFGHMSLIGPRPLVFGDVDDPYQIAAPEGEVDPVVLGRWRQIRSQVRPGMTGLWQVNGRSSLPLEGWLRYDVEYVERCSLMLDLHILVRTVAVVLVGRGAV